MRTTLALILACALVLPAPALAQQFVEVDHVDLPLLLPGADAGRLGRSVALADHGRFLLTAAPEHDDLATSGSQNGSVFSLAVRADGTLQPMQEIKTAERFRFGQTLAADGDWAAIGEASPVVHLYRLSGGTWVPAQVLTRDDDVVEPPGVDIRGITSSAAMDGTLLALGNTNANVTVDDTSIGSAGAVALFRRSGTGAWEFEAVLTASTPVPSAFLGGAVAVSGDTVLVGAIGDKVGGEVIGGAYVFQRIAGIWTQVAVLRNPDAENARYAWSVALDGDVAVVGCATCFVFPDGPSNTGSFFSFERNLGGSGAWGLRGEFLGSTPGFIDDFSSSLRLRGNVLLVGEEGEGEASFFVRSAGGWDEVALLPSGDAPNTNYGIAVDFMGGKAVVGADAWPNTSSSERWGSVTAWYSAAIDACGGNFGAIFCDGFDTATDTAPAQGIRP